jgi:hypothetical protein
LLWIIQWQCVFNRKPYMVERGFHWELQRAPRKSCVAEICPSKAIEMLALLALVQCGRRCSAIQDVPNAGLTLPDFFGPVVTGEWR